MNKPKSLRTALEQALPELKRNPDNLIMYIDDGDVFCALGDTDSFKYKYKLTIVVLNFTKHPDHFFVPLLGWIKENEQGLFNPGDKPALSFEAEQIKHDATDIAINLTLTEPVIVRHNEDDTFTATHPTCPPILNEGGPTGWTLSANGEDYEPEPEPAE